MDEIRIKSYKLELPDINTYVGDKNISDRFKDAVKPLLDVTRSMSLNTSLQTVSAMREEFANGISPILKSYEEQSKVQMLNLADILKSMKQSLLLNSVSVNDNLKAINEQVKNIFAESMNYDYTDSLKEAISSFSATMKEMQLEQLNQIMKIDYSEILPDISSWTDSFIDILNIAYETICEEQWEEEDTELETDFSGIEEVQESIQEQISNPEKFLKRIAKWAKVKRKKFLTFSGIMFFIYSIFIEPYLQQNIGMPVMAYIESNVKDWPEKGAEVICRIKEGIEAIIIENTNYYYKVSFTDENGVEQEGYVAKRNLKLIQQNTEEEEESEENDENDEAEVGNE